jgi:hypothetical protein
MKYRYSLFVSLILFSLPSCLYSQPWSGILLPTSGSGACTVGSTSAPSQCAIDWTTAGIPGGIPSGTWTQSGSTITAAQSPCNNGAGDCTATIQAALNACSGSKYVLLGAGTFKIAGANGVTVPSNCVLRGAGANQTILKTTGASSGAAVILLGANGYPNNSNSSSITSGAAGGSTSIVVASASGISVGGYLLISELNNPTYVSISGSEGACTWCDGGTGWNGTRVRGQIVEVTSVAGSTIGISPALYSSYGTALPGWTPNHIYGYEAFINPSTKPTHYYMQTVNNGSSPYTCTSGSSAPAFSTSGGSVSDGTCTWQDQGAGTTTQALATYFAASAKYAGVENLQVYQNNTGYGSDFEISMCAYCWISGVEGNYADGDQVSVSYGYRGQIQNSYFSNAFIHGPGAYDSDITLYNKSSGMLVQNNILERLHVGIMLEWGAAGNVIAYNYNLGNYADGSTTYGPPGMNTHGAHPQFNLWEGNITENFALDSIWGSHSSNTAFRNWSKGTTKLCTTGAGAARAAVSCGSAPSNWTVQQVEAFNIAFLGSAYNLIGNIIGSQDMANLLFYNTPGTPLPQANQVVAVCGPSPCGPGSRSYDDSAYAYVLGFGESSDDGSSGDDSIIPYNTLFAHGNYTSPSGAITWQGSVTHTLPASFYLSSQPSWWNSSPWPSIGPDITGGLADAFGHAFANPAETCYESTMGGTDGTGSPLTFNPNNCYGGTTGGTPPTPPSSLSAVSQ